MTMPSPAVGSQPPEEAPVTRRSTELLMTSFGLAIVALAFAATALSLKGQHPSTIIGYIVSYCVIIMGAHLAVRRFAPVSFVSAPSRFSLSRAKHKRKFLA